ncbi:serine carboxypeptidase-like 18 [Forsythia ovata]|uniref:Serine carboxypeptidase-like 18 n=1 Tax=Forsythia ovata TaxID=205694 RepID=A0ABD1QMC4_9LAMI
MASSSSSAPFSIRQQQHHSSISRLFRVIRVLCLSNSKPDILMWEKIEKCSYSTIFVESERNPKKDPLLLWLTGGPGCSALSGLVYEIGPFTFDAANFDGSLPSIILNPYSWTKVANIIFIDWPVGTGFSYSNTSKGYSSNDTKTAKDIYTFLRKWLLNHPMFIKNRLYIAGDSYGGKRCYHGGIGNIKRQ